MLYLTSCSFIEVKEWVKLKINKTDIEYLSEYSFLLLPVCDNIFIYWTVNKQVGEFILTIKVVGVALHW